MRRRSASLEPAVVVINVSQASVSLNIKIGVKLNDLGLILMNVQCRTFVTEVSVFYQKKLRLRMCQKRIMMVQNNPRMEKIRIVQMKAQEILEKLIKTKIKIKIQKIAMLTKMEIHKS